jgi:phospholipase C
MSKLRRREFLRSAGAAASLAIFPPSIRRALAIPANVQTGTIQDVKHVVILMQENRSFDHYFGTLRGVRGFGDPVPIPLPSGKNVWFQSDGSNEIPPYHLNPAISSALLIPETPHTFPDTQAAWNQGAFGQWPLYKTPYSMGYYHRADIPFQFALAEAFTICDAYHCSLTAGTEPNRILFFSGSNFDPRLRAQGINCTSANAEVANVRCNVSGKMPTPGYTYSGTPFTWQTIPEVLQAAGVTWRFYQDPNNNSNGGFNGVLAFENFRQATVETGGPLYENGMTLHTIQELRSDVINGALPQVSWIIPSISESEHPSSCSPDAGANYITQVLDAITANPTVWSQTALLLTYDENDGLFDHVPPPAVPSYNADGTLAGASTLSLAGEYFSDPDRLYLDPADTISGTVRPWGLGGRVPAFVISPWSRGGWVNSQVFDHTSVAMFLEKRFGVTVGSISPWHRAICGDLTSAFDFETPNDEAFPSLPNMSNYAAIDAAQAKLPSPTAPSTAEPLYQELGTRPSRALPYVSTLTLATSPSKASLQFSNDGTQGVVFHVYDLLHSSRIPRRYTVEPGKSLTDSWTVGASGTYHLRVYGPNGFARYYYGNTLKADPEIQLSYSPSSDEIVLLLKNPATAPISIQITPNSAALKMSGGTVAVPAQGSTQATLNVKASGCWYDFTVTVSSGAAFGQRFAGRMETGEDGVSDPAMGTNL